MQAIVHTLIAYFSLHSHVALAAIFAAAALEALAVIGTLVPGSSVVFIGGVLIGLGVLDPWWTVSASVAGAVLGDGFSYWLGTRYRERLLMVWPIRQHRTLFDRGRAYFLVNGGKSVFFGRFLGPVRAIVPVVAGMSGMPALHFYWMNLASALAWSVAHIFPGLLFGASLQVAGAVSSRLVLAIFVVAALSWLLLRLLRLMFRQGSHYFRRLRDGIVSHCQGRTGPVARLALSLLDPARPESGSLLVAALLLIAGGWLFLGIVEDIVYQDPLVQFDRSFSALLESLRTDWLDQVMVAISYLGGPLSTLVLIGAISLYFAYRRYWRTLGYWLAAAGFAEALVWVLKLTLGRARPHPLFTGAQRFSFPSGHAIFSIVVYGFLAFLLAHGKSTRCKVAASMSATVAIVLISFSRLYLGAHWLSDVLGSLSLGLFWVALLSIAHMNHVKGERIALLPVALIAGAMLLTVGFWHFDAGTREDVKIYSYQPALTVELLPDWKAGGWSRLPVARSEVDGDLEEPFTVQWAGTGSCVARALGAAGWQTPQPWALKALLLWLVPRTPVTQLPVLPKLDQGRAPVLVFIKVLNPKLRAVLRLWPSPYYVAGTAGEPPEPLWEGILTLEQLRRLPGLTISRTASDFIRPVAELQKDLGQSHSSIKRRERPETGVLLVWQGPKALASNWHSETLIKKNAKAFFSVKPVIATVP